MTPRRPKPKRLPGENPFLRLRFVAELRKHNHFGDLAAFIDDLADESLDIVNPYALLEAHLDDLVIPADPPRHRVARLTPVLGHGFFRSWLRHHGIDPKTGKMTLAGLAFFRSLAADHPRPHPEAA